MAKTRAIFEEKQRDFPELTQAAKELVQEMKKNFTKMVNKELYNKE